MTKNELINAINEATGGSKKDAALLVDATFDALKLAIQNDGKFSYPGFGTFTMKTRAARKGRNPRTGEIIDIKASKNVGFKAATGLKSSL